MKKKKKIYFTLILVAILIIAGFLFCKFGGKSIEIGNGQESDNINKPVNKNGLSPITGLECENYNRRPIAVMLATDPITRPLSGISQADLVVEMPVITGSITRFMAVFGCESPEEIGSVRSARHDFIPLALGLDAIYAHWGGSHFAYDKLNMGIINNIDAMKDWYGAYYRKSNILAPHNGFTSIGKLLNAIEKSKYRTENKFSGYLHEEKSNLKNQILNGKLTIGYGGKYGVYYEYNPKTNIYLRWRGGEKEIDRNNNKQVEASVIAIMRADSKMIEPPNYNEVDVEGRGEAIIYQNGEEIKGYWKKEGNYSNSKLYFMDDNNNEIKFTPGKIWIEIVEPVTEVKWKTL